MTRHTRQLTLATTDSTPETLTDLDWTFSNVDTSYLTHGLHKYPAVMPPQIPANLLQYYKSNNTISTGDTIYDPFIGSGTTIVEARLHGLNAIGNDINPFACLLTTVKSTPVELDTLKRATTEFLRNLNPTFFRLTTAYQNQINEINSGSNQKNPQTQTTLSQLISDHGTLGSADELFSTLAKSELKENWYPKPQLYHILFARKRLNELANDYDEEIMQFLRVVLSKVARQVSYQRRSCFKRWRMAEADRVDHNPNVYTLLREELKENRRKIREFNKQVDPQTTTIIFQGDSRSVVHGDTPVTENHADIVITSPPYGDHQTTVAYGEFSTDLAIIAENRGFKEMQSIDKKGLGGQPTTIDSDPGVISQTLAECVTKLREKEGRSDDALSFFHDYARVIEEVGKAIKPGQPAVWVVANRRMSDFEVPLATITAELCESAGFKHEVTINRGIKNKNMPQQNAQGRTMVEEYIVVTTGPTTVSPLTNQ